MMNALSPLSFDDFLRTPRTAGDSDSAYTFSIVPPTPQDLVLTRPMISPVYGQFNSPTAWGSLMSPSPLATGIMASVEKSNQQAAALRLRSRSPSVESRSSHRHSPYSHSRKSSGASASSVLLEHTYNTTAGVGESVNISQLGSINPAFLRPTGGSGRNSDASDHGSDYHYNAFPQLEESDDSDDSDDEDAVAAAKGPSQRTPAIRAVTQSSTSRLPTPARSETASNAGDEEWQATSKRTSKQKRRPAVLIEDPPQVKLVTAITASGKKSHARKRPEDHIPRPRNAFILFRKHVVDAKLIPPEVEIRHQNISVVVSKMWAEADPETKTKFQEQARIEKEAHMKNYPDYKYQPVYRRANVVRRKMKPDPVEEKRCTVVASLLLEGKEGAELEAGAAKAVEASNKKRLKIQKALAAKEARQMRQAKRSSTSRRNRRATSEPRKSRSGSEHSPGSFDDEEEEEDGEEEEESAGMEQPRRHKVTQLPTFEDSTIATHPVPRETFWNGNVQVDSLGRTAYQTEMSEQTFQYATGMELAHAYQPGLNYQAPPQPQAAWQDDHATPAASMQFDQGSAFAHSLYGAPQYHLPTAQPSDYIMAMYDNGIQPMGFTAGPPANHASGIPSNAQGNDGHFDPLEFDMSHYEEALADMAGFSGGVWP